MYLDSAIITKLLVREDDSEWFEQKLTEIHDKMRAEKAKPTLAAASVAAQPWEERILRYKRNPNMWVIAFGPPPGAPWRQQALQLYSL